MKQTVSEIINVSLSICGAAAGIYGAIRAWLSNRQMKQIEGEKLATKLNIDVNYELIESDKEKLCQCVIKWTNLGLANIKIIKLNIDARDREDEMRNSYIPPENNLESTFKPLSRKIENLELIAINNHKLVNFSNNKEKGEVKIYRSDPIYGLELSSRQKRQLKEKGEEVEIDPLRIKKNISDYIKKKATRLQEIYSRIGTDGFKNELKKFLFHETLVKELRGIQLFPEETRQQEFFLRYEGEGVIYLNVESATIRLQLKNIDSIEKYKLIADEIIDSIELTSSMIKKFEDNLKLIITPAAMEIHKQKSNLLIYLK